ncbi:MAG: transketolase [Blautia sp.]|nr:transketolase [Blautia sp.]MCM1200966.1 transketolase [Bacteroides fragilis]
MREAFINQLYIFAQKDRDIILMSGDLGFGVLDKFRQDLPGQYFNAGICEQNMASMAAGAAMEGKKVYLYSIANFPTLRCIEQIRNDICYHNANVKVVSVGGGFAYGALGMSHHATEDIAIMRSLPQMNVYVPCDPKEAVEVAKAVYELESPCYIRLNKGGEPELLFDGEDFDERYNVDKLNVIKNGCDICILSTGAILWEVLKASEILKRQGIAAAVYNLAHIKPIDQKDLRLKLERFDFVVTVEEHNLSGGFGSAIAEILVEGAKRPRMLRLGIKDEYAAFAGSQSYIRKAYGLDGASIAKAIIESYKSGNNYEKTGFCIS